MSSEKYKFEFGKVSILYHSFWAGKDNADADIMGDNCEEAVDEPDCRDGSEEDKPEVEEDVDLFIDDIQGKDTEGIVFLNCSWGAILLEEAFCNLKHDNIAV